ncbi:MAG: hypothetical protein WCL32_05280 [Planctomycetota bacterium]
MNTLLARTDARGLKYPFATRLAMVLFGSGDFRNDGLLGRQGKFMMLQEPPSSKQEILERLPLSVDR